MDSAEWLLIVGLEALALLPCRVSNCWPLQADPLESASAINDSPSTLFMKTASVSFRCHATYCSKPSLNRTRVPLSLYRDARDLLATVSALHCLRSHVLFIIVPCYTALVPKVLFA